MYIETIFAFYEYVEFCFPFLLTNSSLLLSCMIKYDCLDTCCLGCLM